MAINKYDFKVTLFIKGNFNGHIGTTAGGYGEVHNGFCFGDKNGGGT